MRIYKKEFSPEGVKFVSILTVAKLNM